MHLDRKIKCNVKLDCENCNTTFKSKYILNRHLNNKNKC